MDDLVQTPYGYVGIRIRTLQTLQSTFATTELLKAVDDPVRVNKNETHGMKV